MKLNFIPAIIIIIALSYLDVDAQWTSLNGPAGGNVTAIGKSAGNLFCAVSDESIYSNNKIDIFSSTDNGSSWSYKSQLSGTGVYQILSTNTAIFAQSRTGSFDYFLYKSTDGGNSWELIFDSLFIQKIRTEGEKIFVPTSQGLQYSGDNGTNWNNISSNLPFPISVLCTETFNGILYAGLPDSGVYKSTNNGISWTRSWSNALTRTIRYIFSFNNTLFASEGEGGNNRIYKSTDSGGNWIQTSFFPLPLNYYYIRDLKVSTSGIFMAVVFRQSAGSLLEGGVFYSSDGNTWELRRQGILPNFVNTIEVNNSEVFVGSGSGVFKSSNNGSEWSKSSDGIVKSQITHFTFSAGGAEWAAGIRGAGAWVSADSGFSWIERNNGLDNLPDPTILSSIVKGNKWFIGTESNGIYTSTNSGNEWISSGLVGELPITGFALKGANDIIATRAVIDGVYRSTDDGNFWEQIMTGFITQGVLCVAVGGAGTIFVGDANGYVLRSTNNSANWFGSEVSLGAGIRFLRQVGLKWFAATSNGIYRSTDFGVSWNPGGLQGNEVNFIAIKDAADTLTLFASTYNAGIFFSTDNGNNWFPTNNGLPTFNITGIRSTGTYLYAGTNGEGLWRIRIDDLITNINEETNTSDLYEFYLAQNYPNPFNPVTTIQYSVPQRSIVSLKVYDILGSEVAELVNEEKERGVYSVSFNASQLASGIYLYRIQAGNFIQTKKMILIK